MTDKRNTIIALILSLCLTSRLAADRFTRTPVKIFKTTLAIKQGIQDFNDSIAIGVSTFKELVQKSKVFIDTSLLLKEFFEEWHRDFTMQVLAPRRWRKTINLDMMKTFLQIQVDEQGNPIVPLESTPNYRLFANGEIIHDDGRVEKLQKPFLIANDRRWLNFHIGRYPVIFLSLKDTMGENFEIIYEKIKIAVNRVFKEHEYMIKVLERSIEQNKTEFYRIVADGELQRFKRYLYMNETIEETDLAESLKFLCHILFLHFKESAIILIDDYDRAVHSYLKYDRFHHPQRDQVVEYLDKFVGLTSKLNFYRDRAFVTGVYKTCHDKWNTYDEVHLADDLEPFHDFYGFTQENVKQLFHLHNIDEKLAQQARQWYNGYDSKYLVFNFYNPVSLLHFLKHRKVANYREPVEMNDFVQTTIRTIPQVRCDLMMFLSQQNLRTRGSRKYFTYLFEEVYEKTGYFGRNLFHMYLLAEGYLTESMYIGFEYTRPIQIANNEAACVLSNWMISYYKQKHHIDQTLLENAASAFHHFVSVQNISTKALEDSFDALYKNAVGLLHVNPYKNTREDRTEEAIHSLLNCVALRMQHLSKFTINAYYNRTQQADLVLINNEQSLGTILELQYDSTPQNAYASAERFKIAIKPFKNITKIKLIGVNISSNKSVNILAKLQDR